MGKPAIERLERKLDRDPLTGCWNWTGVRVRGLYGLIRVGETGNWRKAYVHRVSYEHHVGPIPEGLELDHLCRNPRCANPAHLEPVTHGENCSRARMVTCKAGHDLRVDENCDWDALGRRRGCKVCRQKHQREQKRGQ